MRNDEPTAKGISANAKMVGGKVDIRLVMTQTGR